LRESAHQFVEWSFSMMLKKTLLFLLIISCGSIHAMNDDPAKRLNDPSIKGAEFYNALSHKLECFFSEDRLESGDLLEGIDDVQSQIITMFENYIHHSGNINYINERAGYSLLSLCCYVGMDRVVQYMVEQNDMNINLTTDNGPPLFTACMQSYPELKTNYLKIISLLLNRQGIDVDVTDSEGNSSLHAAYLFKFQEAVDRLIEAGANQELENKNLIIPCNINL